MSEFEGKRSRIEDARSTAGTAAPAVGKRTLVEQSSPAIVQQASTTGDAHEPEAVHAAAARGIATPSSSLPHANQIQRLFGRHDISSVQAHVGNEATASANAMGAAAYTAGNHVVLGKGTDLATVAHEAAHVVQQRGGVQLKGDVGDEGDKYEQHADAVAARVVAGQSAEKLLDEAHQTTANVDEEEEEDVDEEADGEESATPPPPPARTPTAKTTQAKTLPNGGGGGGRRVVQLAREPAVVTAAAGAGLHKSDRKKKGNAPVKVRSGGLFGTGKKATIDQGTRIIVDSARPVINQQYIYAENGGQIGYVKKAKVQSDRIANSEYYALPDPANTANYRMWNDHSQAWVGNESFGAMAKGPLVNSLAHVMGVNTPVRDKDGLIAGLVHQTLLGTLPDPNLWQQAAQNIDQKIAQRVQADRNQLVQANLITQNHNLAEVKFTGADFHKHGQAPFFLYFRTNNNNNPDERTVVYKPSNLNVDNQLFGAGNSLASALDANGTQISHYTILTRQDNNTQEHYGYMQFVQSGVPTDTNDLLGVYRSLAANMALSYLAGLEDVHQENVLLLRDRVQVIDMEATTGRFTKNHDNQNQLKPNEGGFRAMLWDKALQEGIKPKLVKAAREGTLQSAPQSNAVQAAMRQTFTAVLGTAAHNNFNNDWQQQTQAMGGHNARIVPIATASFYQLIASAKNYNTLNAWQNAVDHNTGNVIDIARGQSGATDQFLANVLRSPGTYNALHRGEIPYYTRNLGRSTGDLHQAMQNHQQANANAAEMLDEEGHPIDGRGSPKIGQDIGAEMNARRTELQNQGNHADVHLMFEAQIVNSVAGINNEIRNAIQAHHNQQNNQNH